MGGELGGGRNGELGSDMKDGGCRNSSLCATLSYSTTPSPLKTETVPWCLESLRERLCLKPVLPVFKAV